MSKTGKYLLAFLSFLSINAISFAQNESQMKIRPFINFNEVVGGSISSNNFQFASGQSYQLGTLYNINENLNASLSIGRENMDDNIFYPIALGMEAYIFNNRNFQALFLLGYSPAEIIADNEIEHLDLYGGFFLEVGRQWRLPISNKIDLQTSVTVRFQSATLEYHQGSTEYEEDADYYRLGLGIGLVLK